jgi:NTE family protein
VITTTIVGNDQASLDKPWAKARTIPVDTQAGGFVDFGISTPQKKALYSKGHSAATNFLSTWNWPAYLERYRCSPAAATAPPERRTPARRVQPDHAGAFP